MRTENFVPADQLAPALAFNDWLRERLRSILDATPRRNQSHQNPLTRNA